MDWLSSRYYRKSQYRLLNPRQSAVLLLHILKHCAQEENFFCSCYFSTHTLNTKKHAKQTEVKQTDTTNRSHTRVNEQHHQAQQNCSNFLRQDQTQGFWNQTVHLTSYWPSFFKLITWTIHLGKKKQKSSLFLASAHGWFSDSANQSLCSTINWLHNLCLKCL